MSTPTTFADIQTTLTIAQNKQDLLNELAQFNLPPLSWETGAVVESLVEVQASAQADYQANQVVVVATGINNTSTGDALTLLSSELFDNDRVLGVYAVGYVTLTDTAMAGPYTFYVPQLTFSIGRSSDKVFLGVCGALSGLTTITLPRGSSVDLVVQAASPGMSFNVAAATINTIGRGGIPGVKVTNPLDWQTKYTATTGGRYGTDDQADGDLQVENLSGWSKGVGSNVVAYMVWAEATSSAVTRTTVMTPNIFDPGQVNLTIAGAAGPVSGAAVTAVQNYIAINQTGGSLVPETVRCIVASAVAHNVAVTASITVQATYNTAAFQAQTLVNLQSYFSTLPIGGVVSFERVVEVLLYQAGTSPGVIVGATVTTPAANVLLGVTEVAVASPVTITYVSV